jgi:type IV pilus assembly protein PilB
MMEQTIHTARDLHCLLRDVKPLQNAHLGEILIEAGVVEHGQIERALERQADRPGRHLGRILIELGWTTQEQINQALACKFGIPCVSLREFAVEPRVLAMLPADIAQQYNVIPLAEIDGRLVVALENPLDVEAIDAVRFNTNRSVDAVIASGREIGQALSRYYSRLEEDAILDDLEISPTRREIDADTDRSVEQQAMKKPIVRLVNAIILQAVMRGASDINVRPEKDRVNVYYRIDGKLQLQRGFSRTLLPAIVSRIKITGQMDIAERRLPQDGHARMTRGGNVIDLRISVMPTVRGESVVIRILDKEAGLRPLDKLGLRSRELTAIRQMMCRSFGMLLVTGPTGSGKSTTLYAVLDEVKKANPHIITVEDPVEYDMPGVEQIQISVATGYTFAEALRHILRHDPDVIMIGEIRDIETARIANKAALTGHLVLSTLHTNDAATAITRLTDMGVESYLLGSTLLGVMAQRLVRLICAQCKEIDTSADPMMRRTLHIPDAEVFHRGAGCSSCGYTGYRGRTTVCELLPVSDAIAQLINEGANARAIKAAAIEQGMVTLTENAIALAREGRTTLEEVFAVRLE